MNNGGFSGARLGGMHDVMTGHVQRGLVPGIVTLVSRRGEVHVDAIGTKAFGVSDPIRRDTIFRVASVTKPIAAAAVMVLPPRFPIQQAMAEAGVAPGPTLPAHAPDELMKRFGSLPLVHQPGEGWLYNSGSDILGVLISRVAGTSLEEFLRERIFAPLGMHDTSFSVPVSKLNRLASSYWTNFATGEFEVFDGIDDSRWASPPVFESGARGLVSTVDDLLAFGEMMLKGGEVPERAHPIPAVG